MKTDESAIQFPCYFPIKIIGKNSEQFQRDITEIVQNHFPGIPKPVIVAKSSKENNFISLTATVYVTDQQALDRLYQDLTKHPDIKMVL